MRNYLQKVRDMATTMMIQNPWSLQSRQARHKKADGERARPRVRGSAPSLDPLPDVSDEGVADGTRRRVRSQNWEPSNAALEFPAKRGHFFPLA
jgi:hypothetical protein